MDVHFINELPENLPQEIVDKLLKDGEIEVVIRDLKKKFEKFIKIIFQSDDKKPKIDPKIKDPVVINEVFPKLKKMLQIFKNQDLMLMLNTAVTVAGIAAVMEGMREINERLDRIEEELCDIQKKLEEQKAKDFEIQIEQPCRKLVSSYKRISDKLLKNKPVSEDELLIVIDECYQNIITLYRIRNIYPFSDILNLIFKLLPVMYNCIMLYYQKYFDSEHPRHLSHDSWMSVFEMLIAPGFIDEIQEYMFINQGKTNMEVNEYLFAHRSIVYGYKLKINNLLEDLTACQGKEGYEDAKKWSRQYAAQQAKAIRSEVESRFDPVKAQEIMDQVLAVAME